MFCRKTCQWKMEVFQKITSAIEKDNAERLSELFAEADVKQFCKDLKQDDSTLLQVKIILNI